MIAVDASFVIALRDPADARHPVAVAVAEDTDLATLVLHPVTLAECLVAPAQLGVLDEAARTLRRAFQVAEVDAEAPERWARLRAATRLRLPDAIVLDTAIRTGADTVVTFDGRLAAAASDMSLSVRPR